MIEVVKSDGMVCGVVLGNVHRPIHYLREIAQIVMIREGMPCGSHCSALCIGAPLEVERAILRHCFRELGWRKSR